MIRSPEFETTLQDTHALALPDAVVRPFVEKDMRRVVVCARFEGKSVRYHAALQKRHGAFYIMFNRKNQKSLGVFPNDYFTVRLEEDQTEFGVDLPPELEEVFRQDTDALEMFRQLTPGAWRSVIYWVRGVASPQRRIERSLTVSRRLHQGAKTASDLVKGKPD